MVVEFMVIFVVIKPHNWIRNEELFGGSDSPSVITLSIIFQRSGILASLDLRPESVSTCVNKRFKAASSVT